MGLAKFVYRVSGNRMGTVVVDRRHVVSVEEIVEAGGDAGVLMRTVVYNYQLYHTLDNVLAALDRAAHEPYTDAPPVTRRDRVNRVNPVISGGGMVTGSTIEQMQRLMQESILYGQEQARMEQRREQDETSEP